MLPGRGRPPHPPQAATVAAARRPRPTPDPAAAGAAAAMSPRPTNRKQAAPGPRRFLRGGGGVAAAPPLGRRRRRKPRGKGPCAPRGLLGNVVLLSGGQVRESDVAFLAPLVLLAPQSSISVRSPEVEDRSPRVHSPISCLFGEVTANWLGKDLGCQTRNQAVWSDFPPASFCL